MKHRWRKIKTQIAEVSECRDCLLVREKIPGGGGFIYTIRRNVTSGKKPPCKPIKPKQKEIIIKCVDCGDDSSICGCDMDANSY